MSFLDWLKELLSNDKREIVKIMGKDLTKTVGTGDKFSCAVYTQNKNLLKDVPVIFKVNDVEYERTTDSTGVASLNIGLGVGEYNITSTFKGDDVYADASTSNIIKVSPVLTATDLSMSYHDGSSYNVTAKDTAGNPIPNIPIIVTVNGVTYKRLTNTDGVASLTINLQAGTYNITAECYGAETTNKVVIAEKQKQATRMEGTNINKTVSQTATYQCAVYTPENQRITNETVDITVNGKTYTKTIDNEGLAKLNINLNVGDYSLTAKYNGNEDYNGSTVTNSIHVEKDPTPTTKCQNPYTSTPFHTTQGGGKLGQKTAYSCGPHSLMQAYYNLTGIDTSETELMSACGCTTSGTSHQGLATGLAYLNRKYGTDITMEWKDFSDIGYTKLGELLCDPNSTIFWHELYRGQYGHYSLANKINTATSLFNILNSLGSRCSYPAYCGYIETRSFSTQRSYWNGISQKSICILRKG